MPHINKPFLLKLTLVLFATVGLLFGANALQARRIPDALRRQADRAAERGDDNNAIHYLRHFIEFCPEDVDAHVQLADCLRRRDPARGRSRTSSSCTTRSSAWTRRGTACGGTRWR